MFISCVTLYSIHTILLPPFYGHKLFFPSDFFITSIYLLRTLQSLFSQKALHPSLVLYAANLCI